LFVVASLFIAANVTHAHSAEEWRGKSIYQIVTDRFWRDDNSTV